MARGSGPPHPAPPLDQGNADRAVVAAHHVGEDEGVVDAPLKGLRDEAVVEAPAVVLRPPVEAVGPVAEAPDVRVPKPTTITITITIPIPMPVTIIIINCCYCLQYNDCNYIEAGRSQ